MLPLRPLRLAPCDSGEVPFLAIFNEGTVIPVDVAAGEGIRTRGDLHDVEICTATSASAFNCNSDWELVGCSLFSGVHSRMFNILRRSTARILQICRTASEHTSF